MNRKTVLKVCLLTCIIFLGNAFDTFAQRQQNSFVYPFLSFESKHKGYINLGVNIVHEKKPNDNYAETTSIYGGYNFDAEVVSINFSYAITWHLVSIRVGSNIAVNTEFFENQQINFGLMPEIGFDLYGLASVYAGYYILMFENIFELGNEFNFSIVFSPWIFSEIQRNNWRK